MAAPCRNVKPFQLPFLKPKRYLSAIRGVQLEVILLFVKMDTVKVAVRIRPMVPSELERGCQESILRVPNEPQVILNNESFTFNYVFDACDNQDILFQDAVLPMLDNLFKGFNVTILAYGQTGSGKTHTMGTNGGNDESAGVIPRAMNYLFGKSKELSTEYSNEFKCCFLELYQEQLYDLLANKAREECAVEIREHRNAICIPDLTQEVVKSAQETTDCLMRGSSGRAVASTAMNQHSSRSHAIFTVTVTSIKKDDSRAVTTAKFHLVDLAGSERSKKTKATGDRFKEGVNINRGLLALGNVISALGSEKKAGFVPYRDSKLTRLLQDSLGGNSITLMIACVSPADYNTAETLSTLRYADRARKIKNKPVINQDPHAAEINHLKSIIQKLRLELLSTKACSDSSMESLVPSAPSTPTNAGKDKMYRDLQDKYRKLQQKLQKTLHDCMENEMRVHIAEEAHEKLKAKTDELKIVAQELVVDMEDTETLTLSEQMKDHGEKVQRMVKMVVDINEELEKTVGQINEHKQQTSLSAPSINEDDLDITEEGGAEIEQQADAYNNKQFNIKEQLCRINHELNLKEQLQQRLEINLNKFSTLDTNAENLFDECQKKIRELENEKEELLDKLQHVKENASAKLAEERRKRLQTLESEINIMKSKIKQQSNLLKVREKETQKIQNLSREIQAMKESKVKLIRTMRQEAENFRQWKLKREKELIQIKTKGRKMENEMARKEALHTKQRNVLKRKCEEAMAINKRLKDALDRQSAAQAMRQKLQSCKDNNARRMEQVVSVVERELEVITSLIEAEQTLEHLMEDRGIINRRIGDLRTTDPTSEELKQLEEEYEMRNAQISELQQKVCAADLDSRVRGIGECIQNMAEARAVVKQIINTICETRREYSNRLQEQKLALDEKRAQLYASEEERDSAVKQQKMLEKQHQEELAIIERTYEEKIALVLSELHSNKQRINGNITIDIAEPTTEQKQCLQIEEDLYSKIESMHDQIEQYKQLVAELESQKSKGRRKIKFQGNYTEDPEPVLTTIDLSEEEADITDGSDDPDWKMDTPVPRRRKRSRNSARSVYPSQSTTVSVSLDGSKSTDESFATAASQPVENVTKPRQKTKSKGCKCKNNCKTKMCGCRGAEESCGPKCRCGVGCLNGQSINSNGAEPEDELPSVIVERNTTYDIESKENIEMVSEIVPEKRSKSENVEFIEPLDKIHLLPDVMDEHSRKIARLTTINFNTPTSKKKFFN